MRRLSKWMLGILTMLVPIVIAACYGSVRQDTPGGESQDPTATSATETPGTDAGSTAAESE